MGLGLFAAMARAIQPGARMLGALEVAPGNEGWPALIGLQLEGVPRDDARRGAALEAWLEVNRLSTTRTAIYLAGHTGTIAALRTLVARRHGYARQMVRTKLYWADGKRGL